MDQSEVLALLRGGPEGIAEWNRRRDELLRKGGFRLDLSGVDLCGVDLSGVNLEYANLTDVRFVDANLTGARIGSGNLAGAVLRNAILSEASLKFSHADGADLFKANLAKANLSWIKGRSANLSQADLTDADLTCADLTESKLFEVNMRGTDAPHAHFVRADLRQAKLTHHGGGAARVAGDRDEWLRYISRWCSLQCADLQDANFAGARLDGVRLNGALLRGTDFSGAHFVSDDLDDVDLSDACGLDKVIHEGPSRVGVASLFKLSRIPTEFLIGCGVPDVLVRYLPDLVSAIEPIQFYSCFISYSSKDEEFCKRLHRRMRDERLRVWFAPEDIKGGEKIHDQISQAIRVHDKLILVLSDQSMQSQWVNTEIYHARQREVKEGARVLFPIRLVPFERLRAWTAFDGDVGRDMAREVREYYIPDFSNWKDHDEFERAFAKLMSDLRRSGLSGIGPNSQSAGNSSDNEPGD